MSRHILLLTQYRLTKIHPSKASLLLKFNSTLPPNQNIQPWKALQGPKILCRKREGCTLSNFYDQQQLLPIREPFFCQQTKQQYSIPSHEVQEIKYQLKQESNYFPFRRHENNIKTSFSEYSSRFIFHQTHQRRAKK